MWIRFIPSIDDVSLRVHLKIIPIKVHKKKKDNIYWDFNGNMFNLLRCLLHESLPLIPTLIL